MRPVMVDDFCESYDFPGKLDDAAIRQALGRSAEFEIDNGYKVEVWGGAIHPEKNWIGWVDLYSRNIPRMIDDDYFLRISVDNVMVFEWNVETYNPAFGAGTIYIKWHGDHLVYIYSEKHRIYGVTANLEEIVRRVELGHNGTQLCVLDDVVLVVPVIGYEGALPRYSLPSWEALPPMSETEAVEQGLVVRPEPRIGGRINKSPTD